MKKKILISIVGLSLTACGSQELKTDPANQTNFNGSSYGFNTPSGFTDKTQIAKQSNPNVDLAVISETEVAGFRDNINVIALDSSGDFDLDKLYKQTKKQVNAMGAKQLARKPNTNIDGEPALAISYRLRLGSRNLLLHQFFTIKNSKSFTITFTYGPKTKPAVESEIEKTVLDSWVWK